MTLVGYVEMKKKIGKVCFVTEKLQVDKGVGMSCDKLFLFDDLSAKVKPDSIGKEIQVAYTRGYNGNAYVADVIIK